MMTAKKVAQPGKWAKGASGNPAGRPPGSRNRATVAMEALLEGEAERLTRKLLDLALDGDITALRLCLERLIPPRKDRPIHLSLPPVENIQQISKTITAIIAGISGGQITPNEGEVLANILAVQTNVLTKEDLERRLENLERRMSEPNN